MRKGLSRPGEHSEKGMEACQVTKCTLTKLAMGSDWQRWVETRWSGVTWIACGARSQLEDGVD